MFILLSLISLFPFRRLGWILSKILYRLNNIIISIIFSVIWGSGIALIVIVGVNYYSPHIIIKIVFGYMLGGYLAVPNYGLVQESTASDSRFPNHFVISNLALIVFVIMCIIFSYTI